MKLLRLGLLCAAIAALGCGDDGGNSGNGADAGPRPDAAPRPDGAPTAGTCGVLVASEGDALAGVSVLFSNPDGTAIGTATTDSAGKAVREDCVANTTITVQVAYSENTSAIALGAPAPSSYVTLATYMGVNPGDTVYLGEVYEEDEDGPIMPTYLNVTLPSDVGAFADADWLTLGVASYCSDGASFDGASQVVSMQIYPDCIQPDGTVNLYAQLFDNGNMVATSIMKDVSVTQGTATTVGSNEVSLSSWDAGSHLNAIVASGISPAAWDVDVEMAQFIGQIPVVDVDSGGSPPIASSSFYSLPLDTFDYTWAGAELESDGEPGYTEQNTVQIFSTPVDTAFLDMSTALPAVAGMVISSADVTRPTVSWLANGPLDDANAGMADFRIEVNGDEVAQWVLLFPDASSGSLQVPELPAEALSFLPQGAAITFVPEEIEFGRFDFMTYTDLMTTPGYDPFEDGVWPHNPPPTDQDARFDYTLWYLED